MRRAPTTGAEAACTGRARAWRHLAGPVVLYAALAFLLAPAAPLRAADPGFAPIELRVTPLDGFAHGEAASRFGALEFRGGVAVTSPNAAFGSLSGLDFTPDGEFIAVSDTGFWFIARPSEGEAGRLTGLSEGRLAPILDGNGRPLHGKRRSDAEGLRLRAVAGGGIEALISFEQRNIVRAYSGPDLALAKPRAIDLPAAIKRLDRNSGLEAIAVAPRESCLAGALLIFAEHFLDAARNHRAWIVGGPHKGDFSIVRHGEFDITDAAFMPGGDLLILERQFSFLTGFAMRIRRIAAADLSPGATVDGKVLIEADMRDQIDNMEAMAVRPGDNGETLITLASDDNGSVLQRTLFLRFALPADRSPLPRARPTQ